MKHNPLVRKAWDHTLILFIRKFPSFRPRLLHCHLADKDHSQESRIYMHTNHFKDTVCYAQAAAELPFENLVGVFAHEFGHILSGLDDEASVDIWVLDNVGLDIGYDEDEVECVDLEEGGSNDE